MTHNEVVAGRRRTGRLVVVECTHIQTAMKTFTSAARGTYASTNLLNNGFPINGRGVVKCNISPERIKAD